MEPPRYSPYFLAYITQKAERSKIMQTSSIDQSIALGKTQKNRLIPIATCNITNLRFRSVLPEISFSLLEKRRVDKEKGQQKTIATAYQITSEHSHAVMAYVEISRSGGVFRRYSNILTYFLPITNNVAIFIVVPCLRRNHLVSAAWCVRR